MLRRYNKVANIIGYTMQYHPHGDASIGDALVNLGQKDFLIDMQGNWGNILTGDSSAAPRYIEARLSPFALEILFNHKTTDWKSSYDSRNKEPITLPVKFPLLLLQGVEGIAVGLACKILPHNFIELINASISYLNNEDFEIYPDFPTYGMADFSKYNHGLRGGKIRVRAKIEKLNEKTLKITELPFGKTTNTLIESIVNANQKGKIKIKKIDDNTAENVEIIIQLATGISIDRTIDALYAFTDCENSISPNACVIENNQPIFLNVKEILKKAVKNTKKLLQKELEIRLQELENAWHWESLERIFIENKIYNLIENCETWKEIIVTIEQALEKFTSQLKQKITKDDIIKLTDLKIKKISKFDIKKAKKNIQTIEKEIRKLKKQLNEIIIYTIKYFENIKNKYGQGKERKTEIVNFGNIEASKVIIANEKLYFNRKDGFIGTSLKNDEFIEDCSDIDEVIIFRKNGTYFITKVTSKLFIGTNILHVAIFKKNDDRTVYNAIYRNGQYGNSMIKRFSVKGITRDKEYTLTQGAKGSKLWYFTVNPNGEAEIVRVILKPNGRKLKLSFDYDFSKLEIKGRNAKGNILTKEDIYKINLKEEGISTLSGRKIYFDQAILKLNDEKRGEFLGEFSGNEQILEITKHGYFTLHNFDLSNYFEKEHLLIEKLDTNKIYTVVYFDEDLKYYYLKRFQIDKNQLLDKKHYFIGENPKSKLIDIRSDENVEVLLKFGGKHYKKGIMKINAQDFISVKTHKARGKRLTTWTIKNIDFKV